VCEKRRRPGLRRLTPHHQGLRRPIIIIAATAPEVNRLCSRPRKPSPQIRQHHRDITHPNVHSEALQNALVSIGCSIRHWDWARGRHHPRVSRLPQPDSFARRRASARGWDPRSQLGDPFQLAEVVLTHWQGPKVPSGVRVSPSMRVLAKKKIGGCKAPDLASLAVPSDHESPVAADSIVPRSTIPVTFSSARCPSWVRRDRAVPCRQAVPRGQVGLRAPAFPGWIR
jgi:hypothetical protein